MSNEDRKPWYKNPSNLGVIIAALALIAGLIYYLNPVHPLNPDFSMSVNPPQGTVDPGGVLSTAITVKGQDGYDKSVSLSASGQPSGVVITFTPPIGGAMPSYTSTVETSVALNVQAGDYTITIKGTGNDGKEHNVSYTLTVKPTPSQTSSGVSGTTTKQATTLTINAPFRQAQVGSSFYVSGSLSVDNSGIADATIHVQYWRNGVWNTFYDAETGNDGSWHAYITPKISGTQYCRAYYYGDSQRNPIASDYVTIYVT